MNIDHLKTCVLSAVFGLGVPIGSGLAQPATVDDVIANVSPEQAKYKSEAGAFQVKMWDADWTDAARQNRKVPVRFYAPDPEALTPEQKSAKFPVIVVSPAYGLGRTNYSYLTKHLASHGYVCVHLEHAGSNREKAFGAATPKARQTGIPYEVGTGEFAPATPDLVGRVGDVAFALAQIDADPTLAAIADTSNVGVIGHGTGAYTAMVLVGQEMRAVGAPKRDCTDPRVHGALAMSPPGKGYIGIVDSAWDNLSQPVLVLTGSNDYGPERREPGWRRMCWEHMKGPAYLVQLSAAIHLSFADIFTDIQPGGAPHEQRAAKLHLDVIRQTAVAFFDETLKHDAAAREWFVSESAEHLLPESTGLNVSVDRKDPAAAGDPAAPASPAPSK